MTRKHKIFLILSLVLLLTDVGLVGINYRSAEKTLMATVRDRGAALHESFDIALYTTELKLIEIATFVAQIDAVQDHLREGRRALGARRDIRIVKHSGAGQVLEVGSGRYDFMQGS